MEDFVQLGRAVRAHMGHSSLIIGGNYAKR